MRVYILIAGMIFVLVFSAQVFAADALNEQNLIEYMYGHPEWFDCREESDCAVVQDTYCKRKSAVNNKYAAAWSEANIKRTQYMQNHVITDSCGKPGQIYPSSVNGRAACLQKKCDFVFSDTGKPVKWMHDQ